VDLRLRFCCASPHRLRVLPPLFSALIAISTILKMNDQLRYRTSDPWRLDNPRPKFRTAVRHQNKNGGVKAPREKTREHSQARVG
jgi:hypothetical protein